MASCSLGASNIKIPKFTFGRVRADNLWKVDHLRTEIIQRPWQHAALFTSQRSKNALIICCYSSLNSRSVTSLVDDTEETQSSAFTSQLIPNALEVESLVSEICDSTSIAEFELKLSGFRLYVTRGSTEKHGPPSASPSPPVTANTPIEAPSSNGSVPASSFAITKPLPASGGIQALLDKAADEGLMILQSPRVGFFRRSRTIKGKRAPPSCKEKQIVKEGQVLCYIEQLGGEIPIESDVSGEVIKILREDGDPVGYGDALLAILPSFPGIKKLQ